jgi:hypothetical protein
MMSSRPDCPLTHPCQAELDRLRRLGIDVMSLARPIAMRVAVGHRAADGRFDPDPTGHRWFTFEEPGAGDIVFWSQTAGALATWCGRSFALGEDVIGEPGTYSFDCALNILADPADWLRARRDGIVVLPDRWGDAFDRLRDCPRVAVDQRLLSLFKKSMKPARLPEVFVITTKRAAA